VTVLFESIVKSAGQLITNFTGSQVASIGVSGASGGGS